MNAELLFDSLRHTEGNPFGFGATLNRVRQRAIDGEMHFADIEEPGLSSSLFDLRPRADGEPGFVPCIMINMAGRKIASEETIVSDAVRTVLVADQYPVERGYSRRLREVYRDVLSYQEAWLNVHGYPTVDMDPRTQTHDEITRALIMDQQFFGDVGFGDWVTELSSQRSKLPYNGEYFTALRESSALHIDGAQLDILRGLSTEERAVFRAREMIRVASLS